MRLQCVVCYGDARFPVDVPCGNGQKSVKWLATVATQRLTTQNAPRGCLRHRDTRSILPSSHRLLPSQVTTEDQSFYHPEAQLSDCFVDGQEVFVVVEPKLSCDETGEPVRSRWSIIANTHSELRQPQRAAALEEEYRLRDQMLRRREVEEEERKLSDNRTKATLMRELIRHQLVSASQLDDGMRQEWEHMNRRGLMDTWIRAEREREKVFAKFRDNYVALLELFRFYSASTTGSSDAHLMEFVEFCAFCRDIDVFGGNNDLINHTTLAGAFAECAGIDVSDVKYAHFELGDFLASLVWLALTTKGGFGSTKKPATKTVTSKEAIDSARRTLMRTRDLSQLGSAFSAAQALQQLFDDNVAHAFKTHQSQLIGPITKQKLATDEILAILYVHRVELETVFKTYLATKPSDLDLSFQQGYMTLNEYVVLLEDSKLLGSSSADSTDLLTMKEVRQAFAGAQDNVVFGSSSRQLTRANAKSSSSFSSNAKATTNNQSMLLSFAEFLEALLRLALLKWEDDSYSTGTKLTMAIQAILKNAFHTAETKAAASR